MYIGIEEVFIGGMAFALGTVIWAYSKVKSQVASGDTIPLRISDLDELNNLNQAYVRKDDYDVLEQVGDDIDKVERALNLLPKNVTALSERQQQQTENLRQTLSSGNTQFQANLAKLSAPLGELESLLEIVEEIVEDKEMIV
tara:strand:- start:141 stop:566 length:426 start_codon:yes stop_codon:yes gene_type:complete